ncbi:MAG TPA: error-prone DNA polymerase, partial [Alphaproteobacteria bacterium]|nr:error-prone DNA polymerase [Alphaproteobacteria bacterium]
NGERHLRPLPRLEELYPAALLEETLGIAERCVFRLDELRYEYPEEIVPAGETPTSHLRRLTEEGCAKRWPGGAPAAVREGIEHELALIAELRFEPFFLTVHDVVQYARAQNILCQGRGSAANSTVCYCLEITEVDPSRMAMLFERFISKERNEPPDIDVDFEHERREEVIQYIYGKYGRERAGIAATVISYRAKSAVRDVGKAMGLSLDTVARLADTVWGWADDEVERRHVRELGLDPEASRLKLTLALARQLLGFPRHLSQHVGGFVITKSALSDVVPIANAAMAERTFVEWDKDDLDALGILKIDVLALGMLTCIRKCFELVNRHRGATLDLARVPPEDPAVYDMMCRADTLGVFQIESRAQMSFLPRMKPRTYYDLVIEIAIIRPGPIQGDMVHPYLRRRNGEEKVEYPSPELEAVLGKTLGVPLFQEQVMKIAIVAAGFTPGEADRLRRAMATFRKTGTIGKFRDQMIEGMVARGHGRDFAARCFRQIEGFADYGFPESHAASFALLAYVSAWLKCHEPAAFACALLNSQPMGFYAPAQILRDAHAHGVELRPVDVNRSDWDCTLEAGAASDLALRLGFRQIKGMGAAEAARITSARAHGYEDARELQRRAALDRATLERLADADAFGSLRLSRRQALWAVRGLGEAPLPLFAAAEGSVDKEPEVTLPTMALGEEVVADYRALRLSLKAHPLALLRARLAKLGAVPAARLAHMSNGRRVAVAGLVLVRQRPGSANGVVFATLEDETGVANVIVWPDVFERFRRIVMGARLLLVRGRLQREGIVIHLVAETLVDRSADLRTLGVPEASPEVPLDAPRAHADEGRSGSTGALYPSRDFR